MVSLFLILFAVITSIAVVRANGTKWKVVNLLIILACMTAGKEIAFIYVSLGNTAVGGYATLPLIVLLGFVGAVGCAWGNTWRDKSLVKK